MRITHDKETDVIYIRLCAAPFPKVASSRIEDDRYVFDFDANGALIGIGLLAVSQAGLSLDDLEVVRMHRARVPA